MLIIPTPWGPPGGPKVPIFTGFDAKMVNIADLDYSANVNSGMRPVLCFFPVYFSPYEENQKGCSSDKPLLGPKIPLRPYAENILMQKWLILQILISLLMPFLEWDKYKISFPYFISPVKRIRRCAYQTNPFWVPTGDPKISLRHDFDAIKVIFYHCKFQNETFLA